MNIALQHRLDNQNKIINELTFACEHLREEIQGQLDVGVFADKDLSIKTYWFQLVSVAKDALAAAEKSNKSIELSKCKSCEEPTPESELSDYGLCSKCERKAEAAEIEGIDEAKKG